MALHQVPIDHVPLLRAEGLCVGYGSIPVVVDLDIVVHPGEVVALLGPNGAGKTTTLMGLSGHLRPSRGTVFWQGQKTSAPLHKRAREGMGYVPEGRSVVASLSTADNLRLGRGAMAGALAIAPELLPLLSRKAGLLSGGEQQLLSLARALAAKPKLLFADELSLGLAPRIVTRLLNAVREAASDGAGVVLVEQHIRQAISVADRAYVLQRGRLIMSGTRDEMWDRLQEIEESYLSSARPTEEKFS